MGYERYRELVLERQKQMGIVPESIALPPVNPIGTPADTKSPTGLPFPQVDYTRPRDSLSAEEKRLFSRMAEVYAGFLSYTDDQIGRIIDFLEQSGQLDNTLIMVVSDKGASGEGAKRLGQREHFCHQYHHAIGIVPTILDCTGVEAPEVVKGFTQHPIEGVSMSYSKCTDLGKE